MLEMPRSESGLLMPDLAAEVARVAHAAAVSGVVCALELQRPATLSRGRQPLISVVPGVAERIEVVQFYGIDAEDVKQSILDRDGGIPRLARAIAMAGIRVRGVRALVVAFETLWGV